MKTLAEEAKQISQEYVNIYKEDEIDQIKAVIKREAAIGNYKILVYLKNKEEVSYFESQGFKVTAHVSNKYKLNFILSWE